MEGAGTTVSDHLRSPSWRGVAAFLTLAFGLAWPAQVIVALVLAPRLPDVPAIAGIATLVTALALMWPPAVGTLVALYWVEHRGIDQLGLVWPPWWSVVLAWLGPPALTVATVLASLSVYPIDRELSLVREALSRDGTPSLAAAATVLVAQVVLAVTVAVPLNSVFALGEEVGWRGYLLPRLVRLAGPWPGLLLHGAIWGVWHAPLILLAGHNYPQHQILGVPLFTVFCVLAGTLLAWLQLASRSVLAPTIAHASLNAIAGLPFLVLRDVDPAVGGVVYSPIGWGILTVAVALVLRFGRLPALLAEAARAPEPVETAA